MRGAVHAMHLMNEQLYLRWKIHIFYEDHVLLLAFKFKFSHTLMITDYEMNIIFFLSFICNSLCDNCYRMFL